MTHTPAPTGHTFHDLGIAKSILDVLDRHNFREPTPIQHQSIPVALEGKDVVGIAQTGTGKTLAFGIPMMQRLATEKGQGLILVPTRELAVQVNESIQKIGSAFGLRTAVLIGGESINRQRDALQRRPHIIIATPGRLIDHLTQKFVQLNNVKILVLDEADRMFDMGFAPQITQILKTVPKERQTMLFSATMPPAIMKIAAAHMGHPIRIEVAPPGTAATRVEQELFIVSKQEKTQLLETLLKEHPGSVLLFSRTKSGAKRLCRLVHAMGHTAAEIHSNRSLSQRLRALQDFKAGRCRVLVATDIAARGIDVKDISVVINFDLPDNPEDYVHRIGRTGRAGGSGKAISFVEPNQRGDLRDIERLVKKSIRMTPLPELAPARQLAPATPAWGGRPHRGGGQGQRRSGGGRGRRFGSSGGQGSQSGTQGGFKRSNFASRRGASSRQAY